MDITYQLNIWCYTNNKINKAAPVDWDCYDLRHDRISAKTTCERIPPWLKMTDEIRDLEWKCWETGKYSLVSLGTLLLKPKLYHFKITLGIWFTFQKANSMNLNQILKSQVIDFFVMMINCMFLISKLWIQLSYNFVKRQVQQLIWPTSPIVLSQ